MIRSRRAILNLRSGRTRLSPVASGCQWGIRVKVVAEAAKPQVPALQPSDCKSVARGAVGLFHDHRRKGRL